MGVNTGIFWPDAPKVSLSIWEGVFCLLHGPAAGGMQSSWLRTGGNEVTDVTT